MKIEEEKELIKKATEEAVPECGCPRESSHCQSCPWFEWLLRVGAAEDALHDKAVEAFAVLTRAAEALDGLLEIAELAMPDSYFQSDSRVRAANKTLAAWEAL